MVNAMVERATSEKLIGPDWALNIEICDILNHDPRQVKDVVKGIRKKIGSRNPKTQLLALTLLETMIKNCDDIVHMHVAEKYVLHEMVKISRKKPNFQVKEKILILVDTWQEAFGGPGARYPQYFAAYQDLLHHGVVFPPRSERAAPVFTPPQTQPLPSYPRNLQNGQRQDAADSSAEPEFPTLSLTEIQNARGIMDVLAEMLNAVDPANNEVIRQEVLVDLVEQCRTYKQRVVHLVNSTSDESMLCQGLALNDDLQRVLAKHEAISSKIPVQTDKSKAQPAGALLDAAGPLIDTEDKSQQPDISKQLLIPAPTATNGAAPTARVDPKLDLLSGEGYSSPKAENSLALVLVAEHQPASPVAHQNNALALIDMFSDGNNAANSANVGGQTHPLAAQLQQQNPNRQSPRAGFYPNGSTPNEGASHYEHSQIAPGPIPTWNGQVPPKHQPPSPVYGTENNASFPPPPWEAQAMDETGSPESPAQYPHPMQVTQIAITHTQSGMHPQLPPQQMGNNQVVGMYIQPITTNHQFSVVNSHATPTNQLGFHPQLIQGGPYMGHPIQTGQVVPSMYPQQMYGNQFAGHGYGQLQGAQYVEQQMYGMSVMDDNSVRNSSYQVSASSYLPPMKPSNKPEDKLFGDLVDMAKVKSAKQAL